MEWEQWRGLLEESRFRQTVCMRGAGFLQAQAVMVAQAGGTGSSTESVIRAGGEGGAHLLTGGLGGLGRWLGLHRLGWVAWVGWVGWGGG